MIRVLAGLPFAFPFCVAAFAADTPPTPASPTARLEVHDVDVGERFQHATFESALYVTNRGEIPARLDVKPVKRRDAVIDMPLTVAPGETATVRVKIDLGEAIGEHSHEFSVSAQEPFQGSVARVKVFALSVLEEPKLTLDFGTVDIRETQTPKSIAIESREVADFRVTGIVDAPPFVEVTLRPDGKEISATVKPNTDFGIHAGVVKLSTNSSDQPQVWVRVGAIVYGDVVPSSNPYGIDVARRQKLNEYAVVYRNRDGKALKITNARVEGFAGAARVVECVEQSRDCKQVRFTVDGTQPAGQISGRLIVSIRGQKDLPIVVWGVLLEPGTKVVSLNEKLEEAATRQAAASSSSATTPGLVTMPFSTAAKIAVTPRAPAPAAEGTGPLIRWSVANEKPIHAYAIYRSTSADGPFLRVNKESIYTMAEDGGGSSYAWRDTSATPGTRYWYYVGYVQNDGKKTRLTAPQEVLAK